MAAIGHPIVGDAKYGGPDAFLTGGISRKLHLHARRIRIDAPDGGAIDVTAEMPPHISPKAWRRWGSTRWPATCLPLEKPEASPEVKRRKVAAAAKTGGANGAASAASRGSQTKSKRR